MQKENELKVRLRTLIDKKKVLQSDTRRLKHASTLFKAIQEAFVQFEQELTKIQVKRVVIKKDGVTLVCVRVCINNIALILNILIIYIRNTLN